MRTILAILLCLPLLIMAQVPPPAPASVQDVIDGTATYKFVSPASLSGAGITGGGGGAAVSNAYNLTFAINTRYTNDTSYMAVFQPVFSTSAGLNNFAIMESKLDTDADGDYDYVKPYYQLGTSSALAFTNSFDISVAPGAVVMFTNVAGIVATAFGSISYYSTNSGVGGGSGDVTQAGLAAGSYAINGAFATNILSKGRQTLTFTNYFGTHSLTTPNVVSNTFIDNKKGVLYVTNTALEAGLKVVNSTIENTTISNINYVVGGAALGFKSTSEYPQISSLNNVVVYGDAYAFRHYPSDTYTKGAVNSVFNSRFYSRREAVEVWFSFWEFESCLFDAANTIKPTGTSTCIAFGANDDSTNVFRNCKFIYSSGSAADQSVGFVGWLNSESTFYNCDFTSVSNTTLQTAIYSVESATKMTFNSCTFDLHGGLLLWVDDTGSGSHNVTNNIIAFNDCFLKPFTNGVVVRNSSMTNYVRGGNLVLSNFENTNKVVFLDRIADTYPTFNLGVNYTNTGFSCLMNVSFYAYGTDNAAEYIAYDLYLDSAGDGVWDSTNSIIGSDNTLLGGPVANCHWTFPLNVGSRWLVSTNQLSTSPIVEGKNAWRIKQ